MIYVEEIGLVLSFKQISKRCTKTAGSARFYCSPELWVCRTTASLFSTARPMALGSRGAFGLATGRSPSSPDSGLSVAGLGSGTESSETPRSTQRSGLLPLPAAREKLFSAGLPAMNFKPNSSRSQGCLF